MRKEELVAQLEGLKAFTSVVSIDNVIALIQGIEPEQVKKALFTQDIADKISDHLSILLDRRADEFGDVGSAEFELDPYNTIQCTSCPIDVQKVMETVEEVFDEFIVVDEEEDNGDERYEATLTE